MSIRKYLLLICLSIFGMTNNAMAVSPHDEKTCIEGTDFDIKRVRQLVVEGKEVVRYGGWQEKELRITSRDIDPAWTKQVSDGGSSKGGSSKRSSWNWRYTVIKEEDENVQRALKNMLLGRLQVSDDQIADGITVGYRLGHRFLGNLKHLYSVNKLSYQYRKKVKQFEVSNERFELLNPRAKNVIESNCRPKQTICLDKNDKVFLGKYPLKRKCWKEEITYNCKTEPQNGCQHLIDQGYHLYKSSCLDKQEDLCLKWKRYYIKAKTEDIERYTDDEDEFDSSKFGSGGSGSGFDGYDGSSKDKDSNSDKYANDLQNGSKRIFDFPRRNRSKGGSSGNGRNNSTDLRNNNASDTSGILGNLNSHGMKPNTNNTTSNNNGGNGKDTSNQSNNNGFQKYQSIPTKGTSGAGGGISGGGVNNGGAMLDGGGGSSKNGKNSEHDAVIAQSIAIDPDFLLQEGTYIPCSLTMRFVSEVAGRIQCLINQDIYGASGRVKLIERGTKAIGVYQSSSLSQGMARMHVIWTKLLTPDYKRVNLVDTQVVGRLGEAGIDGRVNSHFAQRFGGALMVSLIKDVVAGVSAKHSGGTRKNTININTFENTKDSTTSIVERMLDASINIPPTMYKKQGDIIGIEVGKDIDFSKIYSIKSKKTK